MPEIIESLESAANSVADYIENEVIPGVKSILDSGFDFPVVGGFMYEIGKPYAFNDVVDPYHRLSNYIKTKMSVVDLIPCQCELNFSKVRKIEQGENPFEGGFFKISYDEKINLFNEICRIHGLGENNVYCGIRLFTTDGTTTTDSFNIQYGENLLQSPVNSLSDRVRKLNEILRSIGLNSAAVMENLAARGGDLAKKGAESLNASPEVAENVRKMVASMGEVLLKGNRVSFPKIWQNTTYTNTLNAQIRLVSPYGHPDAVKKFIIKPLMFLLILASPHTIDGMSYGDAMPLTIKAYGMNYTALGTISNITLRRGGNDTSFNVYRQPLTVDVSIDFQTLLDGFAVYKPLPQNLKQYETQIPDYYIYHSTGLFDPDLDVIGKEALSEVKFPLPTMKAFVKSLAPVKLVGGKFQIYGNFVRPMKPDLSQAGQIGESPLTSGGGYAPSASPKSQLDLVSYALKSAKDSVQQIGLDIKNLKDVDEQIKNIFKSNIGF